MPALPVQQLKLSPSFDEPAIRKHVEMLHQLAVGLTGKFVVSAFFANPNGEDRAGGVISHHAVGDTDGTVESIMAHAQTPNANVYICPNLMRPSLERGKKGGESDVIAVLAIVADMDDDTGRSGAMPIEPNYVVESSPGNFQCFLLLAKPLSPQEAKPLASGLKRAANADHCTVDVSHVWRVAGCLNWPNAKKLSRGRSPAAVSVTVAKPSRFEGRRQSRPALASGTGGSRDWFFAGSPLDHGRRRRREAIQSSALAGFLHRQLIWLAQR